MLSTDADGVPDAYDSCVLAPNGPDLAAPLFAACPLQLDEDGDGYGKRDPKIPNGIAGGHRTIVHATDGRMSARGCTDAARPFTMRSPTRSIRNDPFADRIAARERPHRVSRAGMDRAPESPYVV